MSQVHAQARTTPRTRAEIRASSATLNELAERYNITKATVITSYGGSRLRAMLMGDPPRKMVTRYMRRLTAHQARVDYHAYYHMNVATEPALTAFKARVGQAMAKFA